ncbi:alpha/beta hydrolase family protein [Ilumatobacter sp.]|uniref:alpha/beta hydrolase family protein n=1 Tax=Ilumatobacter sp. TaxID=1967498 RepID=UPI003AF45E4C
MKTGIRVLAAVAMLATVSSVAGTASAHPGPEDHPPDEPYVPPIEYVLDETTLPFEPVPGFEDSDRRWGELKGAGYRIEVPADWNGELVMWAHGFRGTDTRLYFNPEEVPFRQWLLENGYAWGASTYSKNDYNVGTAVKDTRRLVRLFNRKVGHPERTYIAGASMGGHITAASIERYPKLYDGAMPVCGVLGDYELFDYFLDFNAAAQQLGLGTSQFPVADDYLPTGAAAIKAGLEGAPGAWPFILNENGEALKQLTENRSGGDRPNFDEAWAFWNSSDFLFSLGLGDGSLAEKPGVAVKNTDVFYETDLIAGPSNDIEIALNEDIVRVKPDKGARRGKNVPSPRLSGDIHVPVLTMHNLGDLFVPFNMETEYYGAVAKQGHLDNLVQRAIRGVNHCGFTTAEYEAGFADLVNWVENGVKPAGDDIGDPAAVAAPDFGCTFTDQTPGGHLFPAPCP